MKNNTENSKQALANALRSLPADDVLSEVRYHIRAAMTKIEQVEKKRGKREVAKTYHEKWQESLAIGRQKLTDGVNNPVQYDPMRAVKNIRKMIELENQKIEQRAQDRQKPAAPPVPNYDDSDDSETLYD